MTPARPLAGLAVMSGIDAAPNSQGYQVPEPIHPPM
jgi:hypothetical protein